MENHTSLGNFHSFSIFSILMASISELCRGLFVPSIYVYKDRWRGNHISYPWKKRDNILFLFPRHYMASNPANRHHTLGSTRFDNQKHIQLADNKITYRWVKLSISLERQLTGYVSIKFKERSLV